MFRNTIAEKPQSHLQLSKQGWSVTHLGGRQRHLARLLWHCSLHWSEPSGPTQPELHGNCGQSKAKRWLQQNLLGWPQSMMGRDGHTWSGGWGLNLQEESWLLLLSTLTCRITLKDMFASAGQGTIRPEEQLIISEGAIKTPMVCSVGWDSRLAGLCIDLGHCSSEQFCPFRNSIVLLQEFLPLCGTVPLQALWRLKQATLFTSTWQKTYPGLKDRFPGRLRNIPHHTGPNKDSTGIPGSTAERRSTLFWLVGWRYAAGSDDKHCLNLASKRNDRWR